MNRPRIAVQGALTLLALFSTASACSSSGPAKGSKGTAIENNPTCTGGACNGATPGGTNANGGSAADPVDGARNGDETDVDCGGQSGVPCAEGKSCKVDGDCASGACNYDHKCVSAPSCKTHLGGDTCGLGEVGDATAQHESCCRSLEVKGFVDAAHPDKKVYLDKYEITAGRVRAWIEQLAAQNNGEPDVKGWIQKNRPELWDDAWNDFLPTGYEGGTKLIARRLLGDPRIEDGLLPMGPGVILPPDTDQVKNMGVNYQFGATVYADLHGNSCGTYDGSYGYPTFWYPLDILKRDGELARADGTGYQGEKIPAKELLDVKSMNCITNAMLAAFCAWDGGQLATDEVLDYVTATPPSLGNISGCGIQIDDHGELLDNKLDHTVQTGGRCAPVPMVNATFDGGDTLPEPGSFLNAHNYHYPDLGNVTHDKAWEISAPGRASLAPAANFGQADLVRINPGDEPWADLNGNLNEAALDVTNGQFTGVFALKYRGIAYGSSRSDLNMTLMNGESIVRIQRPEVKAAYTGGRCMRFK